MTIGEDLQIQTFFHYLEENSNLQRLTTNLDNNRAPIHRWFPFLAGFSHKLVEETLKYFCIIDNSSTIFDPFMGSGTTGVVCKELGVDVIGNESNIFLFELCKLKTNPNINPEQIIILGKQILKEVSSEWKDINLKNENTLLRQCYPESNLKKLVALRDLINLSPDIPQEYKQYLSLIVTMSLSKSAKVGINVPYVSWSYERVPGDSFLIFEKNMSMVEKDLNKAFTTYKKNTSVKLYLHDSRTENKEIKRGNVDMIFTSPPYLNNLDYGEALKVFLYFWKIAEDWGDITQKIRKQAVVSSTTYYSEKNFISKAPEDLLGNDITTMMPTVAEEIITKIDLISAEKHKARSKKSFDIMTALYFKDMYHVIREMQRVLRKNALAFMVIGDSAPYGVHVPTDSLLGEMAVASGFSSYTLRPLRIRGTKWQTLKYRHNKMLRESLLILRR